MRAGSVASFTNGALGVPPNTSIAGRFSIASGSLNTSDTTRNSVTAFTTEIKPLADEQQGYSILPFTKGPGGAYFPPEATGWKYTLYNYNDPAHKHAVTSLSSGESYEYDANGNMTERVEGGVTYAQEFDIENRLESVTVNSQMTTFVYDGDGNLVKKIKPDGTSTLYIGGIYEVDLNSGGSATKKTSYYPSGGMRVEVVGGSNTLYYLLKDHLGSASMVLDNSGNVVQNSEQRYYPFGEKRLTGAVMLTDKLFTGQREMAELGGIYHYGARFYSPKLGRFLSADTIVPGAGNPQNLNRYAYVMNNPLKFVDPTGHCASFLLQYHPEACEAKKTTQKTVDFISDNARRPWTEAEKNIVQQAADDIGAAIIRDLNKQNQRLAQYGEELVDVPSSSRQAFSQVFGTITFRRLNAGENCGQGCWGQFHSASEIYIHSTYINNAGRQADVDITNNIAGTKFIVHEIGHVFDHNVGLAARNELALAQRDIPNFPDRGGNTAAPYGFAGVFPGWQQSSDNSAGEEFADQFVGWTYNTWATNDDSSLTVEGQARSGFMNTHMALWINLASER